MNESYIKKSQWLSTIALLLLYPAYKYAEIATINSSLIQLPQNSPVNVERIFIILRALFSHCEWTIRYFVRSVTLLIGLLKIINLKELMDWLLNRLS